MMTVDSETQGSVSVRDLSSYDVSLPPIEDLNTVVLPACLYLVVEAFSAEQIPE